MDEFKIKLYLISGNLMFSMNSFLTVYLLSFFFDENILGVFTLALSIAVPFFTFADFQLRNYFIINGMLEETFFTIVCIKLLFTSIAAILSLSIFYIFSDESLIYIIAVILLKITDSTYDILYGLNVHFRNYILFFKENIVRTSILFLSFFVLIAMNKVELKSLLIIFSAVNLCFLVLYVIKISRLEFESIFYMGQASKIVREYGSFSLAVTINSYSTNVPKYFAQFFFGTAAQAGLSFYLMLAQAVSRLISPIQNYYRKDMSIVYKQGSKKKLKKLYTKLISIIGVFFMICSVVIFFVKSIGLLKVEFSNFEIVVLILGVYLSTIASIINTILHAMDILTKQFILSVVLIIIMILVNVLFGYFKIPMSYVYLIDGTIMIGGFTILLKKGLKKMK